MPEAPPICVCFAVPAEARPFRRCWGAGAGLRLLVTGIGPENARRAIRTVLDPVPPRWVITSGFAGGLDPELAPGDLVHAGFTDEPTRARLEELGARDARFVTVDRIAVTVADKATLRRSTGADAVEMESGIIREECDRRGVPCGILRVISDAAHEPLPLDFNALLTPDRRLDFVRLACHLAGSPGRLVTLLRFERRVRRAATTLAGALGEVVRLRQPRG